MITEKEVSKNHLYNSPYLNLDGLKRDIGKLMVLAPHPDDESLGCGGLISLLRKAQSEVHIVFMTDGSASHTKSSEFPPNRLAEVREQEAIEASSILGVELHCITFLRLKDSKMHTISKKRSDELVADLVKMFSSGAFNALAIPWRRDPHCDHISTYEIGARMLDRVGLVCTKIEYPIWLWKNGKIGDWPAQNEVNPYRLRIDAVTNVKQQAIRAHRSQLGELIMDDSDGFVLTDDLLVPFRTNIEYYFFTNGRNRETLGQVYFNRLYKENPDPWNFKSSIYELDKYRISIAALGKNKFENALEIGCSVGVHSGLLADVCMALLGVDISEVALNQARIACKEKSNVQFKQLNILTRFPSDNYDLITFCEIGYYFKEEDLLKIFNKIDKSLLYGGKLLFVHWTPYVPDYPLTGSRVHAYFEEYALQNGRYIERVNGNHELFKIQIWEKSSSIVHK